MSIAENEGFFQQEIMIRDDVKHSQAEQRFLAVGLSNKGKYMFVGFMLRRKKGETVIRPITARYMRMKEVHRYDNK